MQNENLEPRGKSDAQDRTTAHNVTISSGNVATLEDLVKRLPKGDRYFAMLRTTASHIGSCFDTPIANISINSLFRFSSAEFRNYLGQRLKPASVNSYCNFLSTLRKRARDFGYRSEQPPVSEVWPQLFN